MKRKENNPTVTLNVKYNALYDLWNHLVDTTMKLDAIQEDLIELTSAIYDICREHENDPAPDEADEIDGDSLAVEILKAVFDCLADLCESGITE